MLRFRGGYAKRAGQPRAGMIRPVLKSSYFLAVAFLA